MLQLDSLVDDPGSALKLFCCGADICKIITAIRKTTTKKKNNYQFSKELFISGDLFILFYFYCNIFTLVGTSTS